MFDRLPADGVVECVVCSTRESQPLTSSPKLLRFLLRAAADLTVLGDVTGRPAVPAVPQLLMLAADCDVMYSLARAAAALPARATCPHRLPNSCFCVCSLPRPFCEGRCCDRRQAIGAWRCVIFRPLSDRRADCQTVHLPQPGGADG